MKRINLSKIGPLHNIVFDGEHGEEYWLGGQDWSTDPYNPQALKCGVTNAMRWILYHQNRGVTVRCVECPGHATFMRWEGVGWVILNHRGESQAAHRVFFTNTYGPGWFIKDEGSTERMLCINRTEGDYMDIKVRGQEIVDVTIRTGGETLDDFTSFTLPLDSNLIYQFEFDPTPIA